MWLERKRCSSRNAWGCRATTRINSRSYDYYKLSKMMYQAAYALKLKLIILEG